jgi:cell division transport system ATP-binding protein
MIVFENVTKKFPLGNVALENVSFSLEEGEFVFLVGPSGAGKTTIIKLILREFLPTSGSIFVDEMDITDKNFSKILTLRRNLGVVFQDFKILYDKNVFENVALSLQVLERYSFLEIKEKVKEALSIVGLADKEKVFPIQLSAGELQRVAIARAIVGERKIILADEPTGNLDPQTSWEIMKIFKKIEKEKTIILATHNVDIVNSFQRRVLVLKNGKIVKDLRKGKYEF